MCWKCCIRPFCRVFPCFSLLIPLLLCTFAIFWFHACHACHVQEAKTSLRNEHSPMAQRHSEFFRRQRRELPSDFKHRHWHHWPDSWDDTWIWQPGKSIYKKYRKSLSNSSAEILRSSFRCMVLHCRIYAATSVKLAQCGTYTERRLTERARWARVKNSCDLKKTWSWYMDKWSCYTISTPGSGFFHVPMCSIFWRCNSGLLG